LREESSGPTILQQLRYNPLGAPLDGRVIRTAVLTGWQLNVSPMLVPQVVVSKRLRRLLKNGEIPDDLTSLGIFESEESKETPRPTISFSIPSSSPSPSPPLNENESATSKLEKTSLKRSAHVERKQQSERRTSSASISSASSSSASPPHSATHKKKSKSAMTNPSQPNSEDLKSSLFGFVLVALSVLLLLLGDQPLFVPLYRLMSPVPTNFNFIPSSERFYDSRILSTGILTPADGEITSSSILRWWVDGAFLTPGGQMGKRNVTFRVFFNDRELQFPEGNTFELTLRGKVCCILFLCSDCHQIDLQVDLEKYGLTSWNVNGTFVSGAHEVILEVNFGEALCLTVFQLT
jgi:hypothetical protein